MWPPSPSTLSYSYSMLRRRLLGFIRSGRVPSRSSPRFSRSIGAHLRSCDSQILTTEIGFWSLVETSTILHFRGIGAYQKHCSRKCGHHGRRTRRNEETERDGSKAIRDTFLLQLPRRTDKKESKDLSILSLSIRIKFK
jgi:hypothetical protein